MELFNHLIYEYKKGLRDLALHTEKATLKDMLCSKLERSNIDYEIQFVTAEKINIFFGSNACVNVIRCFGVEKRLTDYTPEEDFILGTMLGYNRENQCKRYLKILENRAKKENVSFVQIEAIIPIQKNEIAQNCS